MRFAVNGQAPQVVKAGASFFKPFGALHSTSGSAQPDRPVRFLAFIVAPKGTSFCRRSRAGSVTLRISGRNIYF